ncbi:MAG: hypothetical protein LBD47_07620 [Treponema sp.]|nr:hypothetical protein [Treponema sp.]
MLYKGNIYYTSARDNDGEYLGNSLHRIDIDGRNNIRLNENLYELFTIFEDNIYALTRDQIIINQKAEKLDLNGRKSDDFNGLSFSRAFSIFTGGRKIYLYQVDGIGSLSLDGAGFVRLSGNTAPKTNPAFIDRKIVWSTRKWRIARANSPPVPGMGDFYGNIEYLDLSDNSIKVLYDEAPAHLERVINDVIYFLRFNEQSSSVDPYQMNGDGSNIKKRPF